MKLVTICATCLVLLPVAAFAAGPFDGTWKVSLQHIQLSKKPIVLLLNAGDFICKTCLAPTTIKTDGTDQKVKGNPNIDTTAVTVIDANTVTAVYKLGGKTVQKLLKEFGSSELVRAASEDQLAAVVGRAAARKVRAHYEVPSRELP